MSLVGALLTMIRQCRSEPRRDPVVQVVSRLEIPDAEIQRRIANDQRAERRELLTLTLTAISFPVTLITLIVVIMQWSEMRKQVQAARAANEIAYNAANASEKLTRDALKLTQEGQRSWVLYEKIQWTGPPSEGPCELIVTVKNFGKIPAMLNEGGAGAGIGPPTQGPPDPKFAARPGIGVLGPEQPTQYKLRCGGLAAPEVAAIKESRARFYVRGFSVYSDLYANRRSSWCLFWNPERNGYSLCEFPGSNAYD
jgi:hypothetical protein